ncbi:Alpha/Beta hydrolase protein [Collybia nuda]|uniref:Alpha/Beta hydrolase protein n=1 Tax=Collybia nuda TaxID=64659 RepID=A0A9P5Y194_9AGAR|nr:Alpha/Beta hydrolase protein [Collybia nuda]
MSLQHSTRWPVVLSPPAHIAPSKFMQTRPVLPLESPPVILEDYPSLPREPRSGTFVPGYSISTHVFPAAWPRCPSSHFAPPMEMTASLSKEAAAEMILHLSATKETQERGKDPRPANRNILWTVANRVVRNTSSQGLGNGLTLIFLHGIGTHKETWEPILRRLLNSRSSAHFGPQIEEVWLLDGVQHGDAALLNEGLLGDTFDLVDYSRDLMNFVLAYLPTQGTEDILAGLSRVSDVEIHNRQRHGFKSRTIVGVGHSLGACSFVYPAVLYPSIFSSLILVESFTVPEYVKYLDAHRKNETACLRRKWAWDSKEAAIEFIRGNSYYQSWHPEILHEYFHHAITETNNGQWRLKSHPFLEAVMLLERVCIYEAWQMLLDIKPNTPLHWVWGGKSKRGGGIDVQTQTTYRHPGQNSNVWHPGVDHLLPQEIPDLLADDICQFLGLQYPPNLESRL